MDTYPVRSGSTSAIGQESSSLTNSCAHSLTAKSRITCGDFKPESTKPFMHTIAIVSPDPSVTCDGYIVTREVLPQSIPRGPKKQCVLPASCVRTIPAAISSISAGYTIRIRAESCACRIIISTAVCMAVRITPAAGIRVQCCSVFLKCLKNRAVPFRDIFYPLLLIMLISTS